MDDAMFILRGMAAKAIAAKNQGLVAVGIDPDQLIQVSAAVRVMQEGVRSAVKDCEACQALGELVTDRCPRCRKLLDILGEGER